MKDTSDLGKSPHLGGTPSLVWFLQHKWNGFAGLWGDVRNVKHRALRLGRAWLARLSGRHRALMLQHAPAGHAPQLTALAFLLHSTQVLTLLFSF